MSALQKLEPKIVKEPSFQEAFEKVEKLVAGLESVGYILTDTKDWDTLKLVAEELKTDGYTKDSKLREVKDFYESGLFKLDSLRDELQYISREVKTYESIQNIRKRLKETYPSRAL